MKVLFTLLTSFLFFTVQISAQTYQEWVEKSCDYIDKGDLVSAEECLKSAMRLEPGTLQRRQGKLQDALVSYTAALSRHPRSITILENRASLYSEMGETEKALNDYNVLLSIEPDDQEALFSRGMLFLQTKNYLSAEQDFDRILEVNEKSVRGRLGHAILEKLRGNYDFSERILNYLIKEMPREWILYEERADLYFLMGKNARAMADISRLFAETTPTASLYVLRGKVKIAQFERESAAKDFEKARELGYDSAVIDELLKFTK